MPSRQPLKCCFSHLAHGCQLNLLNVIKNLLWKICKNSPKPWPRLVRLRTTCSFPFYVFLSLLTDQEKIIIKKIINAILPQWWEQLWSCCSLALVEFVLIGHVTMSLRLPPQLLLSYQLQCKDWMGKRMSETQHRASAPNVLNPRRCLKYCPC